MGRRRRYFRASSEAFLLYFRLSTTTRLSATNYLLIDAGESTGQRQIEKAPDCNRTPPKQTYEQSLLGMFGCKSAPFHNCSIRAPFSVARSVISGGYYRGSFESVIKAIVWWL